MPSCCLEQHAGSKGKQAGDKLVLVASHAPVVGCLQQADTWQCSSSSAGWPGLCTPICERSWWPLQIILAAENLYNLKHRSDIFKSYLWDERM